MVRPSSSLVLANRITRILPNEILAVIQLKGGPLGDNEMLESWLHILQLGDNIHWCKWEKIKVDIFYGKRLE